MSFVNDEIEEIDIAEYCEVKDLGFSEALVFLKHEKKITRESWGEDEFICYELEKTFFNDDFSNFWLKDSVEQKGIHIKKETIVYVKGNVINDWTPNVDDILAFDWKMVEE